MRAIDFVARRGVGVVERGVVAADAAETVVNMGSGVEFSLNLRPGDIQAQSRQGNNLEIVLIDGRVIVLEGYFVGGDESPNRLFISSGGTLNEVNFIEGADGALFEQYGTTADWGKWSPNEDLIFAEDPDLIAASVAGYQHVSMLGASLLGVGGIGAGALAAGAAGVALLAGGETAGGETAGGETADSDAAEESLIVPVMPSDDPTRIPPTVDGTGRTDRYGGDGLTEDDKSITVTGTAEVGSEVTVVIGGETVVVTSGSDGTWSATFDGDAFPADGEYDATVMVVEGDGTTTVLTGQTLDIDTTPPTVEPTEGTVFNGDYVNAASHNSGTIKVSGSGEAGSSIDVTIDGTTHSTTVAGDGSWSVDFASTEIAEGDRTADVVIKTMDDFGNSYTRTEAMRIDTIPPDVDTTSGFVSSNYVVSHSDMTSDGLVHVGGTGEVGAKIRVELEKGAFRETKVGADGKWDVDFTQSEIGGLSNATGYTVPVTITAWDSFNNASVPISDVIRVDTLAEVDIIADVNNGGDHVGNRYETGNGTQSLVLTGTSEPGTTSVAVTMNGYTRDATVDPVTGNWSVAFEPGTYDIGTNTYQVTAVSTDAAGNNAQATISIRVDTEVTDLSTSSLTATGADGYVGLDDAKGGFTLTGMVEKDWADLAADSAVMVRFRDINYPAAVNQATGEWSVEIPESAVSQGFDDTMTYTVTGQDSAGNSRSITGSVVVDTIAPDGINVYGYSVDFSGGEFIYEDFDVGVSSETMGVARVELSGAIIDLVQDTAAEIGDYGIAAIRGSTDQLRIELEDPISNGESLIFLETDAAGNSSGILVLLNGETSMRDASNANLADYNIEAIELGAMEGAQLTLTEADIKALSSNTDTVAVRGGGDDAVDISGATATGTASEGGIDYNVYSLGDATIYIDDEITKVTI